MKVRRLTLRNFRGVSSGTVLLDDQSLLVGANSVGKSTVCEALDLVLGPERMLRRPVIDEFDFYAARYQEVQGELPEVRIEAVLTDLSAEAQRRFGPHLRRWDERVQDFMDTVPAAVADAETGEWALPVVFLGRFDPEEDDFVGGTFFAHPTREADDLFGELTGLGAGLVPFKRDDKRLCGFLYLRPNRTGNRALTFQRGSLLDTIVRLEAETAQGPLWEKALADVASVAVATGGSGFVKIQSEVRDRVAKFLALASADDPVDTRVSELTREHLREVLRLFIATQPGTHGVPFNRLSTGSLNLLVFALLTYIAELKGEKSVIFAMEEPEIALPPHAQRRLVDHVVRNMGQVIVTSHSPYVIERFSPDRIVVLDRTAEGAMTSAGITLPDGFKPKRYTQNRRQFAEAVLARAVLVVEGATEAALMPVISDVLDQAEDSSLKDYLHIDLAGVSVFDAGNDVSVPLFAPLFKAMGKRVYGIHDTPDKPFADELAAKTGDFTLYRPIAYSGVEALLAAEVPVPVQRRFLGEAAGRPDYPREAGALGAEDTDETVRKLTRAVLTKRKPDYAALLVGLCQHRADLPASLADFLLDIDLDLRASSSADEPEAEEPSQDGGGRATDAA
ncbi:AAA family ATPase [Streptomyces sp. VNUA24]|uniref:ATP-dependent nuclease n=1 Tax=Streptomyces sp. VNUA24 TaxID=3031131 RepID=UPI0023B87D0A|nr:AAA family ATPase [Streptomyces sp. VNUA24]WEH12180.1 AAA family ATPase [Streptomyces sp. VNUA24]